MGQDGPGVDGGGAGECVCGGPRRGSDAEERHRCGGGRDGASEVLYWEVQLEPVWTPGVCGGGAAGRGRTRFGRDGEDVKGSDRYKVANCIQAQPVFYGFARLAHGKVISVSVLSTGRTISQGAGGGAICGHTLEKAGRGQREGCVGTG